jgi:urea transporter
VLENSACAQARADHSSVQLTASVRAGVSGRTNGMNVALTVIALLMLFVPFVLVAVLFVWGAAKDGQEDMAVQRRLGIRRRTRLGR